MLKNLSFTFATSIAILVANIVTGVLTARWLGPTGKGELTAIILWPTVLAGAGSLGLVEAIVYLSGKDDGERVRTIWTNSIIAAILVSVLAGCASVPAAQDDLFSFSRTYNGGGDGSGGDGSGS